MEPRHQRFIGEITPWFVITFALWKFTFNPNSFHLLAILFLLVTIILSVIYSLSLIIGRPGFARIIYLAWCVFWLIPIGIFTVILATGGLIGTLAEHNYIGFWGVLKAVLFLAFCSGTITFLYWTGLKGLRQSAGLKNKRSEKKSQIQKVL